MRLLLALILAAGLVGCEQRTEQPSQPAPPEVAKAPDVQKPESKIEPPVQEKRNPEKGGNPKRLYQLADLRKGTVKLDGKPIEVWVMDSESKRAEGMMWLEDKDVKADQGMLFVFPQAQDDLRFWMQNTVLPLDITYISSAGKVLNVVQGKPFDETGLPSKGKAQFVLEMKQGSAKRLGFGAGSTVSIPAELKKAQ